MAPETVTDAAQQALADRRVDDGAETLDGVAFFNATVITEDYATNIVALQVQGHALDAARELNELPGERTLQAVDTGDPIAGVQYGACFRNVDLAIVIADLALQDVGDPTGLDVHR